MSVFRGVSILLQYSIKSHFYFQMLGMAERFTVCELHIPLDICGECGHNASLTTLRGSLEDTVTSSLWLTVIFNSVNSDNSYSNSLKVSFLKFALNSRRLIHFLPFVKPSLNL